MSNYTDKELLVLAAKACDFGKELGVVWTKTEWPRDCGIEGALWDCTGHGLTANLWNPLNDDAQALRLAVKLKVDVIPSWGDNCVCVIGGGDHFEEPQQPDIYAAMRRAIVRAAAAIVEKL